MSLCSLPTGSGCQGKAKLFVYMVVCLPVFLERLPAVSRGRHVSGVCFVYRVGQVSMDTYAWTKLHTKIMS